jgi:hypothetical protein
MNLVANRLEVLAAKGDKCPMIDDFYLAYIYIDSSFSFGPFSLLFAQVGKYTSNCKVGTFRI